MRSIKTKLLLLLILISLVPVSTLGLISYYETTEIFTNTVQGHLQGIVRAKESALEDYFQTTESIAEAIGAIDVVQIYIQHTNREVSVKNRDAFKRIEKRVENILYTFQEAHWGRYHHIFLINRSHQIVISPNHGKSEKGSPSSHLGEITSGNIWAHRALQSGEATVSDYSSWTESDHNHQMLFYPVKNPEGEVKALIGFELQIPYEQKILTEGFRLGETGSIFMTTDDGIPIVYGGTENERLLSKSDLIEVDTTGTSAGRRINSKGKEVIGLYVKHHKYPWIIVAEIEADEAFRELYGLQTILIVGFLAMLVLIGIMSLVFSNAIVKPILTLTAQMEKISLGDFDVDIEDTQRKDEIGKLILAFQRLVVSLKIAMKQLQQPNSDDGSR